MTKRFMLYLLVILLLSGCQQEKPSYFTETYSDKELEGVTMEILNTSSGRIHYIVRVNQDNMIISSVEDYECLVEKWENNRWEIVPKKVYATTDSRVLIDRMNPYSGSYNLDSHEPLESGKYRLISRYSHYKEGMFQGKYSVKAEFEWRG